MHISALVILLVCSVFARPQTTYDPKAGTSPESGKKKCNGNLGEKHNPPPAACCTKTYTVKQGDSLDKIATQQNVPGGLKGIEAINPQISNFDLIFPGDIVCLAEGGAKQ